MRIALVIGTLEIGGTEAQMCRLAAELQQRGHVVKVFAVSGGGPLADRLSELSVPFEIIGFRGFVYRSPRRGTVLRDLLRAPRTDILLWRSLWRFHPDVCHAFLPWAYMLAMPGAALGRVPARIAARRSLPSELHLRRWERALQRVSVRLAHAIVANSESVAEDAQGTERISRRRLRVIPNGVDLPNSPSDVARTPPVGLMVANLIPYKGHEDLICAMQGLRDPPVVRLVGDGPARAKLEAIVSANGLDRVLRFEGSVVSAGRLFAEAQFAVLASHQEGMPNAVLEAMSYGVPVVATAVGGVVELIEDGVSGLLVPPHAPSALGAAIERVSGDPSLRIRLGAAARERVRLLSWERCVDAHERLYSELLGGSSELFGSARPGRRSRGRLIEEGSAGGCDPHDGLEER